LTDLSPIISVSAVSRYLFSCCKSFHQTSVSYLGGSFSINQTYHISLSHESNGFDGGSRRCPGMHSVNLYCASMLMYDSNPCYPLFSGYCLSFLDG
jgi:hypothetical protein